MDRPVLMDFGPKICAVTGETVNLARQAEERLRAMLAAAGTDFYGETGIRIEWRGGQIRRVLQTVEQSMTPD